MKKLRFLSVFAIIAAFSTLTSCSDDQAELLEGGQGGNGTVQFNVNYTVPGDSTKIFSATYVTATANNADITINAENEDTGETMTLSFTGNKIQTGTQAAYVATVTYTDADGNSYTSFSPYQNTQTGAAKLNLIDTGAKTIGGVFSFIGFDGTETAPADGTPFYSGVFINIPYTGNLPEPTFMKATIDSTAVDFETVSTITTLDTITTYRGSNAAPKYSIDMKFIDNADVVQGATVNLSEKLQVEVRVNDTLYTAKAGSVKFNTVTDVIVTGTFLFTASTADNTKTVQVTAGDFKMLRE